MKKIALIVFSLIFMISGLEAQSGSKLMKKASRYYGSYNLDPAAKKGKLAEAFDLINEALQDETVASQARAWLIKGKILNEISDEEIKRKILDPNYKVVSPNAGIDAFEAFEKAIDLAKKKNKVSDALKALLETENHLNNYGIYALQDREYPVAYKNFNAAYQVYQLMKEKGKKDKSRLNDPKIYREHIFYTAVSAYNGNLNEEAKPYLLKLYDSDTDEPIVYEALFNIYGETDEALALSYLEEGRKKFPDNAKLLFAEINYYVKKGEQEKVIDKLEKALSLEPENVSIYTTLGSVFDKLSTKETEAGNKEQAKLYFDKSLSYFLQALELDENNFHAIYSIGALYYNAGANMTKEINEYANDFSKEGTKKYNEIKAKMDGLFDDSLPYFERAEKLNPKDLSVLQALSEIYARKNMLDKSKEYKNRLEELK